MSLVAIVGRPNVGKSEVENFELLRDLLMAFASEETMRVLVHYFDKE